MAAQHSTAPPAEMDSRINVFVFMGDIITFITGLSFIPATTVMVGLASRLTEDKALIGLVAMMWSVSWLIPQLVAARMVHGKRRQKPYLIIPSVIGRQTVLLFALWLALTGAQDALLTLWLLIAAIVLFNVCDALAGISWFDMMARALTPQRRGRVFTIGQLIGSVLGIGSGLITAQLLAPDGLPYPMNYAVIFGCAWLGFMASLIVIFFLKENPMSEEAVTRSHEGSFFTHIGESLRNDPVYRRLLLTRLLTGVETMTAAFYVVYIKERLSLPDSSIGAFSVAYIVGGILGVALFGAIADRYDPRRVINAATVVQFLAPTLALVVAITPLPDISPLAAQGIFMLILALNGAIARSMMLGFAGYAIDRAPDRRRAIYVGVFNTLGGVVALSPVLGGLFLDGLTASLGGGAYVLMFAAVALVVGLGAVIGLTLPKPVRAE